MAVEHLNEETFESLVVNSEGVVLVDFFATWCGPCKMLAPIIEEIADESDGTYAVYKVDIDECEDLAMDFQIMSVPTLVLFKDGEDVDRFIGVQSKSDILSGIKALQ